MSPPQAQHSRRDNPFCIILVRVPVTINPLYCRDAAAAAAAAAAELAQLLHHRRGRVRAALPLPGPPLPRLHGGRLGQRRALVRSAGQEVRRSGAGHV